MQWYLCKCIFLVSSLGVFLAFLIFVINSPFDSIYFCDFICLILKPCKSLSFKALCGAAFCSLNTDCWSSTIGFDLDQTLFSHIFAKLKGSNLFKHPLYEINFLSLIILLNLFFAFLVALYLKGHLPSHKTTVISMLRTESCAATLFSSLLLSPKPRTHAHMSTVEY